MPRCPRTLLSECQRTPHADAKARHRVAARNPRSQPDSGPDPTGDVRSEAFRDALDRGVDLDIAQGRVRGREPEAERETLLAGRERRAAVEIEQGEVGERVAGRPADRGGHVTGGPLLSHDDGEVSLDDGVTRRCPGDDCRTLPTAETGNVELGNDRSRPAQLPRVDQRWMELTDAAGKHDVPVDSSPTGGHERRPARMEQRFARQGVVCRLVEPEAPTDELDHALEVVDVVVAGRLVPRHGLSIAGRGKRQVPPFASRRLTVATPLPAATRLPAAAPAPAVALADLEDRHVR